MQQETTCRKAVLIKMHSKQIVKPPPLVVTATAKSARVTDMAVSVTAVSVLHGTTHLLIWNMVQPAANPMHR
jgi:hypothetical protein